MLLLLLHGTFLTQRSPPLPSPPLGPVPLLASFQLLFLLLTLSCPARPRLSLLLPASSSSKLFMQGK